MNEEIFITDEQIKKLVNERDSFLEEKEKIYNFILDSYNGSFQYLNKTYLYKHLRESTKDYSLRKEKSVYFNFLKEISKVLSGLLYLNAPTRNISKDYDSFLNNCYNGKSFYNFIKEVSLLSFLFPIGILIDTKRTENVLTKKEEKENIPFCKIYLPTQIRDFCLDEKGNLSWIILDNSNIDKSDIFNTKEVFNYKVWTKEIHFDILQKANKKYYIDNVFEHKLEEIPFTFTSWEKSTFSFVNQNISEEISILSKNFYNKISEFDYLLSQSVFQTLFYPLNEGEKLPNELRDNSFTDLFVLGFNASLSHKPFFDSPKLDSISDVFEKYLDKITKRILSIVGLDKDLEKNYVQSGYAKSLEFIKTKAILSDASTNMENLEIKLLNFVSNWTGYNKELKIKYDSNFDSSNVDSELERLVLLINNSREYPSIRKHSVKAMSEIILSDLTDEDKKNIDIELENNSTIENEIEIKENTKIEEN